VIGKGKKDSSNGRSIFQSSGNPRKKKNMARKSTYANSMEKKRGGAWRMNKPEAIEPEVKRLD